MLRRRVVFVSAMVGLLGITLLGVVGASSSAGVLPGQPATSDLLEKTVARSLGTCVTPVPPVLCTVTWLNAPTYCQTTYGSGGGPPPMPPAACMPTTGTRRPCGNCTGEGHVYCEYNSLVLTRCCQYGGQCCAPLTECTTNNMGCRCVATAIPIPPLGIRYMCYMPVDPAPVPLPCMP